MGRISRRPVITIAQRPNGATVDAADPAVKDIAAAAVGNIAVVTVPAGKNTAVVASPKYITVVAAAVGTAVAAVADGPCRHAYHGLHYPGLCRCYGIHILRFALPNRFES